MNTAGLVDHPPRFLVTPRDRLSGLMACPGMRESNNGKGKNAGHPARPEERHDAVPALHMRMPCPLMSSGAIPFCLVDGIGIPSVGKATPHRHTPVLLPRRVSLHLVIFESRVSDGACECRTVSSPCIASPVDHNEVGQSSP